MLLEILDEHVRVSTKMNLHWTVQEAVAVGLLSMNFGVIESLF